jgi:hypothetical protein
MCSVQAVISPAKSRIACCDAAEHKRRGAADKVSRNCFFVSISEQSAELMYGMNYRDYNIAGKTGFPAIQHALPIKLAALR